MRHFSSHAGVCIFAIRKQSSKKPSRRKSFFLSSCPLPFLNIMNVPMFRVLCIIKFHIWCCNSTVGHYRKFWFDYTYLHTMEIQRNSKHKIHPIKGVHMCRISLSIRAMIFMYLLNNFMFPLVSINVCILLISIYSDWFQRHILCLLPSENLIQAATELLRGHEGSSCPGQGTITSASNERLDWADAAAFPPRFHLSWEKNFMQTQRFKPTFRWATVQVIT